MLTYKRNRGFTVKLMVVRKTQALICIQSIPHTYDDTKQTLEHLSRLVVV